MAPRAHHPAKELHQYCLRKDYTFIAKLCGGGPGVKSTTATPKLGWAVLRFYLLLGLAGRGHSVSLGIEHLKCQRSKLRFCVRYTPKHWVQPQHEGLREPCHRHLGAKLTLNSITVIEEEKREKTGREEQRWTKNSKATRNWI
ncbi:hypothetical protein CHS0354_039316 [Potamilus streckersoni]|uniref:Uncharacterized protein n=1 Tax=Potamilus streckersoni TaxID=2493646 RepID=A0AAE0WD64_9BIVA|nr:hypothetical protein CHS0354_039316 [Potamilus streckersoni]